MAVLSHAQLEALWIAQGGNPLHADVAAAVAQAESGGDTTRINNTAYPARPGYHAPSAGAQREYSVGLWQINELAHPTYTTATLLAAAGNAHAAIAISSNGSDFGAWTTFNLGTYLPFLAGAPGGVPGPAAPPPTGLSLSAQHSLSGWHKLSLTLGGTLPRSLAQSSAARRAALRALAAGPKVRRGG